MKELQDHVERLQRENDQLRARIEKIRDLGKDVRDNGRAVHPMLVIEVRSLLFPTMSIP